MNQEELDFIYFKENQLYFVDFNLGIIDTKLKKYWSKISDLYF